MELLSYKSYIEKIFADNFNYEAFAPENSNKLFDLFKRHFYCDTPYWKVEDSNESVFYVEFKKYGENRKRVFLKFSFFSNAKKPRELELALTDEELNSLKEIVLIPLSDIWKDHSVLVEQLKNYVKVGLDLAEKTN